MNEHAVQSHPIEAPSALAPNWNWNWAIPQPGHMGVDFEGRVDFRRMHAYRLGAPVGLWPIPNWARC